MAARYPRSTVCILDTAPSSERFHASGGTRCQHTAPAVLPRSSRTVQRRSGRAEESAEEATLRYHLRLGPVYGSHGHVPLARCQTSELSCFCRAVRTRRGHVPLARPTLLPLDLPFSQVAVRAKPSSKTQLRTTQERRRTSRAEPAGLAAPLGQGETSCCPVG